ncbi:MAG: putative sugar nucleotidyl transferase, partial [Candidatus Bathyarchaeia archaeon]
MIIALFEDERCFDLLPLVYSRPVFGLRTGIFERFESYFNDSRKILFVRDYLTEKVKAEYGRPVNETEEIDEDVLFLNGSLIIDHDLRDFMVSEASKDVVVTADKRVVSIHLHERKAVEFSEELEGKPLSRSILKDRDLKKVELTEAPLIRYPWDLV